MKCLQWGSAQAKRKVPNCILKMRARAAAFCGTCLLFSLLLCCCLFSFSVAGGFVAVKVLRALVKWNSSGTLLDCSDSSLSNSIGLAKPNKCQQRLCDLWPAQMFCLAMLPDLIRFPFHCWPTKQFVTFFSIAEKSSSSRAGKKEGNLLPTTVFWDCSLSLALSHSFFLCLSAICLHFNYSNAQPAAGFQLRFIEGLSPGRT